MLLKDKVVMVVPGTFGLGFQAARRFAREGARLLLCGESERNGERALALLAEAHPDTAARYARVVLTEEGDFERAIETGVEAFGAIDAAFGCPDHFQQGLLGEVSVDHVDLAIARNVRSLHFLVRHLAPALAGIGGGSIALLSSMYARVSGSTSIGYEVSKGMAACMARSYGEIYAPQGVRVNAVLTGHYVFPDEGLEDEHPVFRAASADEALTIAGHYPIGRFADADEVAGAAAWLLSDAASYACGTELLLDGALTRR
jgi:NAD(P)-dependent dehydrogenase (short-subunit alcohol dehydrogenase family)